MAWHAARSLLALRAEYDRLYPDRSKASDGLLGDASHQARPSDHNPDYQAPGRRKGVVRAIDLTTTHLKTAAAHRDLVQALLDGEMANPVDRIWYVIHRVPGEPSRLWSRSNGWRPVLYKGSNPHDKHIHVSLMRTAAAEDDTKPWLAKLARKPDPVERKETADMPSAEDVWKADLIPNDGITGNAANKTVTPITWATKLFARLARVDTNTDGLPAQLARIEGKLDELLGKDRPLVTGVTAEQVRSAEARPLNSRGDRMVHVRELAAACDATGFPFFLGLTIMQKESNGRNVYGSDTGGALAGAGEVTEANYATFRRLVLDEGHTSNGVGPMQITFRGYFPTMESRGLKPWVPADSIMFGVMILRDKWVGLLRAGQPFRAAFWETARSYNGGTNPQRGREYADDADRKAEAWLAVVGQSDCPDVKF